MREIKAIIRPERLGDVLRALHDIPSLPGVTVSQIRGFGRRYPPDDTFLVYDEVPMTKLEVVTPVALAEVVVRTIERAAHSGLGGDGKIFVLPVEQAIRIRSGDRGHDAL